MSMITIYKNPQAKKALFYFISIAFITLIISLIGYHMLAKQFTQQLNEQAAALYSLHVTQGNLLDYLQSGQMTQEAYIFNQQLLAQRFSAKQFTGSFHFYNQVGIVVIWLVITLLAFGGMTIYFKRLYQRINTLNDFANTLNSETLPIDIRHSQEGVLSQLEHSLYQVATTLHNQYSLSKGHADYLSENIANISHQLKTPLTALWVVNDSILSLPVEQRTDELLYQFEPQLQRINNLIQALLLMTRLEAKVISFKKEAILLESFFQNIHEEFHSLLISKQLFLNYQGDLSITVQGDSFYLHEAVANIMKNAVDHANEHTPITIKIDDNAFYSTITIENVGLPIDKADLPYIFKRFYKGKNAKTTSIGIGLSLAHDILSQHSGKLSAQNTENGVCFIMTIPK